MTIDELRAKHPDLIPTSAVIEVRAEWLGLIDQYFSQVKVIYGDTTPSVVLYAAYESDGLIIDCDDLPWSGSQARELKRQVRELSVQMRARSRDV